MLKVYDKDKIIMFETQGKEGAITVIELFLGNLCIATTEGVTLDEAAAIFEEKGHLGRLPLANLSTFVANLQEARDLLGNAIPDEAQPELDKLFPPKAHVYK